MGLIRRFLGARGALLGGVGRALSQRNYRLYALGHVAHVHGWWGNRLGIGWLTWELTGSAAWLGIVTVAGMIPVMLIAPLAGAVADRYGHRQTAMTAGILGSLVTGILALLTLTGRIDLDLLLVLTIIQGTLFGLEFPARQALIPQLVGKANISAAVAFNSTSFQLGAFLGPVLAAALISAVNIGASILLYCGTTLLMVTMIRLIDIDKPARAESGTRSLIGDMGDGFRYVWNDKALRLLFLVTFANGFFIRSYVELLPGFAAGVFDRGAEGLGALNAASGLGALLVAVWMVLRGRTRGLVVIMAVAAPVAAVSLIGFALTPGFSAALPMLALVAGALIATQVANYSLVQIIARADMRGRVISLNISIIMGAPALGTLAIGRLADGVGLPGAVMVAGAAATIILIPVVALLIRRRHQIEAISDPDGSEVVVAHGKRT